MEALQVKKSGWKQLALLFFCQKISGIIKKMKKTLALFCKYSIIKKSLDEKQIFAALAE